MSETALADEPLLKLTILPGEAGSIDQRYHLQCCISLPMSDGTSPVKGFSSGLDIPLTYIQLVSIAGKQAAPGENRPGSETRRGLRTGLLPETYPLVGQEVPRPPPPPEGRH